MTSETTDKSNTIVTVTPIAHIKLLELRDAETEGEQLGLRLEILSEPGEDFRYDLSFDFRPIGLQGSILRLSLVSIIPNA